MSCQLRAQSSYCQTRQSWALLQKKPPYAAIRTLSSADAIVISGVSGRLPSCNSFEEFGRKLREGQDFVSHQKRFCSVKMPPRLGLLGDLDKFDAEFFKMPPRLAEASDPQVRMLLEAVFETLIDAGENHSYFVVRRKPVT